MNNASITSSLILPFFFLLYKGSKPKYRSFYGWSGLPVMLDNLGCTGNEETLLNCIRSSYGVLNCHGYKLAGVECEGNFILE